MKIWHTCYNWLKLLGCAALVVPQKARLCIPVYSIDGCHLSHGLQTRTLLLLTARDGNKMNIILAYAICASEGNVALEYFCTHLKRAGLEEVLNNDKSVFITDR